MSNRKNEDEDELYVVEGATNQEKEGGFECTNIKEQETKDTKQEAVCNTSIPSIPHVDEGQTERKKDDTKEDKSGILSKMYKHILLHKKIALLFVILLAIGSIFIYDKSQPKQGELSFPGGGKYVGIVKNGKPAGMGIVYMPDGRKYSGIFTDFRLDGQLSLKTSKGIYTGKFSNGALVGQGKFEGTNGDIYKGEFLNGLYHGLGELIYKNGKVLKGTFVNGIYTGGVNKNITFEKNVQYQKIKLDTAEYGSTNFNVGGKTYKIIANNVKKIGSTGSLTIDIFCNDNKYKSIFRNGGLFGSAAILPSVITTNETSVFFIALITQVGSGRNDEIIILTKDGKGNLKTIVDNNIMKEKDRSFKIGRYYDIVVKNEKLYLVGSTGEYIPGTNHIDDWSYEMNWDPENVGFNITKRPGMVRN